jgi:hypothetical protein
MKYRSKTDYAQIYAGDKQGFNLGLDGAMFLRKEDTPRTFKNPRIGTQGSSTSAASPSTDINSSSNSKLKVNVDGSGIVDVTLVPTGKTTGALIAAELETKINAALLAAGKDNRVWVAFESSLYKIRSQFTGTTSSIVVTAGSTLDITVELKLGLANSGVETAGTNDQDFLLYTTGGPKFNQPIESNKHRSGRFHSGIVKAKKVAEFDFQTYVNMSGAAGESIDTAVDLLWEQLLGTRESLASTYIKFTQGLPSFYFSLVRVSTIFGEYYTGGYVKECSLEFPGDGPATASWKGKAATRVIAGIALVDGAVSGDATVILTATQGRRFDRGSCHVR